MLSRRTSFTVNMTSAPTKASQRRDRGAIKLSKAAALTSPDHIPVRGESYSGRSVDGDLAKDRSAGVPFGPIAKEYGCHEGCSGNDQRI